MHSEEMNPLPASYQLFMLVLCLFTIVMLAVQRAVELAPETRTILEYADFAACGVFFVDFLISVYRAPNRWRYFATWGWLDLLSSIPTIDVVRWGRAARILRVFRVLRGLRATKIVAVLVLRRRTESTFLAVALVALLLVVFCSIAILHFETEPESNIKSAEDAIWWSFATITTVGYGDRYPVTTEGRFTAAVLMCGGVGLFGTFSGFLAAWFISPAVEAEAKELHEDRTATAADFAALRDEVRALREALFARDDQDRKETGAMQHIPSTADAVRAR